MQDKVNGVSRRNVLKATGGSIAAASMSGLASAKADKVEVNVGFDADSGRAAALEAADGVTREFNFDAVTITVPRKAADALANRPDVRYVEENGTMHALAQTPSWGNDRVDADVTRANGETGAGADIAIIDSGIDSDHPDLQANLGAGRAFVSARGPYAQSWDDDNNHGTHCAGIADGVDNSQGVVGVSTQATLHAVKVLDSRGSGSFSDVAAGIEYVGDQGWDVGSLSLGASSGSQVVKDAGVYATERGVFLVAAAGNSGPCTDCVGYPAAYPEFMAVSSTNSSDGLSSFSSQGPQIEIAAPGSSIYSSVVGGYDTYSGTSMATPQVAGAGGLLMANGASNSDARSTLKNSAENIGLASNESGAGLLDAAAAVGLDSSDN